MILRYFCQQSESYKKVRTYCLSFVNKIYLACRMRTASARMGDGAPGSFQRKKNPRFRKEGKMTDICLHYKRSLAMEPPRGWSYLQGTCISFPSRGVCVLGERAKEESEGCILELGATLCCCRHIIMGVIMQRGAA